MVAIHQLAYITDVQPESWLVPPLVLTLDLPPVVAQDMLYLNSQHHEHCVEGSTVCFDYGLPARCGARYYLAEFYGVVNIVLVEALLVLAMDSLLVAVQYMYYLNLPNIVEVEAPLVLNLDSRLISCLGYVLPEFTAP